MRTLWARVCDQASRGQSADCLPEPFLSNVRGLVNSATKSYRYVLPTQLSAKLSDPRLDCRCLQMSRGGPGAFDARTIAHGVVVPFDQENNDVLGGSAEPYVNNPLRVPEVSARFRNAQKNKADWDALCCLLEEVERRSDRRFTESALLQVLCEVHRRLQGAKVAYPAPRRTSLDRTLGLLTDFLATASGGDRLLAVASGLFEVIGARFGLYSRVRRANITAADASTGLAADLECLTDKGDIFWVVEVKDRELTITQLLKTLASIRQKDVSEIFFLAQQGIAEADRRAVRAHVDKEFISGHNVYVTDLMTFGRTVLSLLGEDGRRAFLRAVCAQLDEHRSDITHRRAWAKLLGSA